MTTTSFPSTPPSSSLQGTTTIIFGGSAGMGKASAKTILLLGGKVVLVARNPDKLQATAAELAQSVPSNAGIETSACDCMDVAEIETFFENIAESTIHHIVVTLGPEVHGANDIFGESTIDKVQAQFGKFNAPWAIAKHGAPKLADGGSLVFFSGSLSRAIMKNSSCLAPVNAAIECLAKCLAMDLGPRLRVNCVSPTLTRTTAVIGGMTTEQAEGMFTGFGKSIPAGRAGEADDIGHAVGFLLTNNFMTGTVLDVDGGKTL